MWTYLLGPFLALLPRRLRTSTPFSKAVRWRPAAILSGLAECLSALTVLMIWYYYSMSTTLSHLSDLALHGKVAPTTTDYDLGTAALLIWSTHPLTWAIVFFGIEGIVRTCAGLADTVLGIFPLYLVEKVYATVFRRRESKTSYAANFSRSNVSSYVGAIRDKVVLAKPSQLADELRVAKNASEEFLEIRASREKQEWTPPRVVRMDDRYYRLEECSRGPAPRPFIYKLRRLPAGVPGRTVLTYSPSEEPVKVGR
ncbi:MAG: hypothetical protein WA765_21290 [Candidatus Acidiferrum sp.]